MWFTLIIVNFSLILITFRFFGKIGLFVFAILSILIANIQALKQISLFGLSGSMGDISYIGIYLISDILSENYGRTTAKKIIYLGIFSMIATTIIMYFSLKVIPNSQDNVQGALKTIFGFFPRIVCASLMAFFISQSLDVFTYQFWRNKFPETKYIWIRNNFSTLFSQLVDNAIFTLIAFYGLFDYQYLLQIFITSCILRSIISIIDTPFIYWSVTIMPHVREI